MTADEIRKLNDWTPSPSMLPAGVSSWALMEIAAQLAELNDQLRTVVNKTSQALDVVVTQQ